MSTQQIATSVTAMVAQRLGYQALSLSEMQTSAITVIKSGSKVEIAGALFSFTGDESINASSWTAIATGATASITLTPSGSAGSQILSANWTPDQPVWSESKQAFYLSAGSVIRFVGGCVKGGVSSYRRKFVITPYQRETNPTDGVFIDYGIKRVIVLGSGVDMDAAIVFSSEARQDWDQSANVFKFSKGIAVSSISFDSGAINVVTAVFEIGVWNMQGTASVTIDTGIEPRNVIGVKATIFNDSVDAIVTELPDAITAAHLVSEQSSRWIWNVTGASATSTIVSLQRTGGGDYDNGAYNDEVINRGYLTVWHT